MEKLQKMQYSTKDIAKITRQQLRKEFPDCKFSVTMESYSGGSSITIALMEAPFKPTREYDELSETTKSFYDAQGYDEEQLRNLINEHHTYCQLNHFTLLKNWEESEWCNGAFLTEQAHKVLQRAVQIAQEYNWDNSDSQIDYFDVHFYLHVELGKWDRPFIQTKKGDRF